MKTILPFFFCFFISICLLKSQDINLNFPYVNGQVHALASKGDTLFIGGNFIEVAEIPRSNLAAIDLNTGALLDWNPPIVIDGMVDRITVHNNTVFVCGTFEFLNRNTLAAFSAIDGSILTWNPDIIFPFIPPDFQTGRVTGVEVYNDNIYIGGYFTSVNGETRSNLAALDMEGNLLAWNPTTDIPVERLSKKDNRLYIAGPFTEVNGQERISFASFDLDTGNLMPWNPMVDDPGNSNANAFPDGNHVYISGIFFTVEGETREMAAKVDTDQGDLLAWSVSFANNAIPIVTSFASWDDRLYMGGAYALNAPGNPMNLTAVDPETGDYDNWSVFVDNQVNALLVANNKLIVGGNFANIDTTDKRGLAVFDLDIVNAVEEPEALGISVFPNPTANDLNIQLGTESVHSIEIYNMQGSLLKNARVDNYSINQTFNVSDLPSGVYNLVFRKENNELLSRELFVVTKR